MTRDKIQSALRKDPMAVFALRPGVHDPGPVHVRGLEPHPSLVERWRYAEVRQPEHPDRDRRGWMPADDDAVVTSRTLVSTAAADRVFAGRQTVAMSRQAKLERAARLVARLELLGVHAAQIGAHVVVRGTVELDELLDRLDDQD